MLANKPQISAVLNRLLAIPPLPDEAQAETARFLVVYAWLNILIYPIGMLGFIIAAPERYLRPLLSVIMVVTIFSLTLFLVKRGRVRGASYLIVGLTWLTVTLLAYSGGGIFTASYIGYFLVAFMAGILLGERAIFTMAAICILSGLALVYLANSGQLPAAQYNRTPFTFWITTSVLMLLLAILQYYNRWTARRSLERARAELAERTRAEQALRDSETRATAMLNAIPDSMFRLNRAGVFLDYKAAKQELYAQTEANLIGRRNRDISPPEFGELIEQKIALTLTTGALQTFEYDLPIPGRPAQTYEARMAPSGSDEVVAVVRNVTARKQAEISLRQSEEKYRSLLASLDSVVVSVDEAGRLLYLNDMAARQLGGPAGDFVGKNLLEIFPKPIALQHLQNVRQVIGEDRAMVIEGQTPLPGQLRWYRTTFQPVHDHTGQVVYALINATDIHNLKTTQEELQKLTRALEQRVRERTRALAASEASLQNFLDTASDLIQSLDETGRYLYVNDAWCAALGYTQAEARGLAMTQVIAPAYQQRCRQVLGDLFTTGEAQTLEVVFMTRHGQPVMAEGSISAGVARDDQRVINGIFRDITERKQAEDALRRANVALESALRLKDEFLANMSHELRTPLNAILGLSESLLEHIYGPLNERQQASLQILAASGHHLLDLINDILDLSKIEAGGLTLQLETVGVAQVCMDSIIFVKELAGRKKIRLGFELNDQMAEITADPKRLKQMLINLLSNAVKFTPDEGQVTLRVTPDAVAGVIHFAVQDNGIGIPPAGLARLFQPFTQLDASLNRQHEGTGLGLALVRRLAELHGGAVAVESEVGQGSCFTLSLPYRLPEPEAQPPAAKSLPEAGSARVARVVEDTASPEGAQPAVSTPGGNASPLSPAGARLLLVEDNEITINTMRDYLQALDYQITVARDGREALDRAEATQPELILMDIQMPGLDGLEAIRRLRAMPAFEATPIIALTALVMPGDRERCLAAGADEYISKPVSLKAAVALIEQLLKK